jgi:CheY-like chemotaxis protein
MSAYAPILLAEDDPDDVFFMRRAFAEVRLTNPLLTVRNGQEAIEYLTGTGEYADRRKYPWPCLLLLDLRLPLMDGFEVLAWLQKRRRPKDLMVAILSSSKLEADVLQAMKLGADAYWVKPQAFTDLLGIVMELRDRIKNRPEIPAWITPNQPEARL